MEKDCYLIIAEKMEDFPVKWYRHTDDYRTRSEELKTINRQIRAYNILALGDSMIKFLPILGAMSIAISGAKIQDLERRYLTGRELRDFQNPDVIIIMAGTNNVGHSLYGVEESTHFLFKNIEATFPNSIKIVIGVRIIPRDHGWSLNNTNEQTESRKDVNDILLERAKTFDNFYFKNPYRLETFAVEENGIKKREINPDHYSEDGLHLSKHGKEQLALMICKMITLEFAKKIEENRINRKPPKMISWHLMSNQYDISVVEGRAFFKGKFSLLSNFRERSLNVFGKEFTTPEAAYQYAKAVRSGMVALAKAIQETKTGASAKKIADDNICPTLEWHKMSQLIMEHIQVIRILTDHDFRRFLVNNKHLILVENTSNEFWARGRTYNGQNKLGKMLGRLGHIANNEHELKTRRERTEIEIGELPNNLLEKLKE